MADLEKEIIRSESKIDPDTFRRLVNLTLESPWLESASEALAELWNLCSDNKERSLIEDLIRRYIHIDSRSLLKFGELTSSQINNEWGLEAEETLIVAVSDNWEADGSQAFIQSLKNKFVDYDGWSESNFCNRIGDSLNLLNNIKNVILVDDFIGTGNTIKRRVSWFIQKLTDKGLSDDVQVYVIAIGAMEFAKPLLDGLDVIYYSSVWLKKGISEYYEDSDLAEATAAMGKLEEKLEPSVNRTKLPSFGYKQSEALFAIEPYNVPNNVFPIFWWPEEKPAKKRKSIFNRLI